MLIYDDRIEKGDWNQFCAENSSPSSFLQSYEWGEYQTALGFRVIRFAVADEGGEYLASAQVIVRPLYLGKNYLEVPKGPVLKEQNEKSKTQNLLFNELRRIAKQENAVLVRVNPPYQKDNLQLPTDNFITPQILLRQMEPADTILVDLEKSEDELLANMHEKSRYNIRLAQKRGIVVRNATMDNAAFEKFLDLLEETAKRDGITLWSRQRFLAFHKHFFHTNPNPHSPYAQLLVGESDGKILAGAVAMLYGDSGVYLYAASSGEKREFNAPSLVLWEAIKLSKAVGKKWYDMWGVAPSGAGEKHSWAGITRFKSRYIKLGVTGRELRPVGTHDLVFQKGFYEILKLGKILRRIIKK